MNTRIISQDEKVNTSQESDDLIWGFVPGAVQEINGVIWGFISGTNSFIPDDECKGI